MSILARVLSKSELEDGNLKIVVGYFNDDMKVQEEEYVIENSAVAQGKIKETIKVRIKEIQESLEKATEIQEGDVIS